MNDGRLAGTARVGPSHGQRPFEDPARSGYWSPSWPDYTRPVNSRDPSLATTITWFILFVAALVIFVPLLVGFVFEALGGSSALAVEPTLPLWARIAIASALVVPAGVGAVASAGILVRILRRRHAG